MSSLLRSLLPVKLSMPVMFLNLQRGLGVSRSCLDQSMPVTGGSRPMGPSAQKWEGKREG